MSILRDIRGALKGLATIAERSVENPNTELSSEELIRIVSGPPTYTGKSVTPDSAMRVATILACVRVLAEAVGQLPWITYRRDDSGSASRRERATEHPVYELLKSRPNEYMSSIVYREFAVQDLILRGNHYAEIQYDRHGYPVALWPLPAANTKAVKLDDGRVRYFLEVGKDRPILMPDQVIHVRLLGGLVSGTGLIDYARETVGYARALDEYQGRFFSNGANMSGYLKHPSKLSKEAKERLRSSWENTHTGLSNAHRLAVLEEGLEWVKTSVSPSEAQAIESRNFTRSELAGIMRVPAHMINDLERATFSNIEHQSIAFVMYDLLPWLVRFDQEYSYKLFTGEERGRYYSEFNPDGLLRGDTLQRAQALEVKRRNGVLTTNEWRTLDNQNPIENEFGDALIVPQHNAIVTKDGSILSYDQPLEPGSDEEPARAQKRSRTDEELRAWEKRNEAFARRRRQLEKSLEPVFEDSVGRIVRREARGVRELIHKAENRDRQSFERLLEEFYEDIEWPRQYVEAAFRGLWEATKDELGDEFEEWPAREEELEEFQNEYLRAFLERYRGRSLRQLRALLTEAAEEALEYDELVEQRISEWEERRPAKVADEETTRGANALAQKVYMIAGLEYLRWFANPTACPFCTRLHGMRVPTGVFFAREGESIEDEAGEQMAVNHSVSHPPLHEGCECQLMGG